MNDIKAIIFDCFGVLTTDGWLKFKAEHFGQHSDKMARATEINHMVDAGLISYQDFIDEISDMAGVTSQQLERIMKGVIANDGLFEFIKLELKPRFKIGLLSNVSDDWLYSLFTPEQRGMFDAAALSGETGIIKPDPRAYSIIAGRLEVPETACI
jgi:FMN phosphatase YigB (HAD superfamily)